MRVLLRMVIDCDADAAWRALHSPRVLAELYGPFVDVHPVADRVPTAWEPGDDVSVALKLGSRIPLGHQMIRVSERATTDSNGPVRILRDSGRPLTGPLSALTTWDHQMAVSPAPGQPNKTLWRDRLVIGGAVAPALWPTLWAAWQWRAARIRSLAPTWAYDPEPQTPHTDAAASP